jgi:hypothetical protein
MPEYISEREKADRRLECLKLAVQIAVSDPEGSTKVFELATLFEDFVSGKRRVKE